MRVIFLGTAAGGGLPQWNCGCASCDIARGTGLHRTQDCLAVSGDGEAWYLLNASPDIRTQILRTPRLAPRPGSRETPLRGVLLTSAELDHTLGIAALREAGTLTVYATAPVLAVNPATALAAHYTTLDPRLVTPGGAVPLAGGLVAEAVAISGKKPRYASNSPDAADWVVAYRLTGGGRTLLYAPCLASWTDAFAEAIAGADVVVLDGTYFREDELPGRTGRQTGHLPIEESLPLLARHPGPRYVYTHLNNTNPAARADTPEHAAVVAAGASIAPEGGELPTPR